MEHSLLQVSTCWRGASSPFRNREHYLEQSLRGSHMTPPPWPGTQCSCLLCSALVLLLACYVATVSQNRDSAGLDRFRLLDLILLGRKKSITAKYYGLASGSAPKSLLQVDKNSALVAKWNSALRGGLFMGRHMVAAWGIVCRWALGLPPCVTRPPFLAFRIAPKWEDSRRCRCVRGHREWGRVVLGMQWCRDVAPLQVASEPMTALSALQFLRLKRSMIPLVCFFWSFRLYGNTIIDCKSRAGNLFGSGGM